MKLGPSKIKIIASHRESLGELKYGYDFTSLIGLLDVHSTKKMSFTVCLKCSSFWPSSADDKHREY